MNRLLPFLFAAVSLSLLARGIIAGWIGLDAEIYLRASAAWLHGGNPWDAFAQVEGSGLVYHYAALPTAVVLYAPLALLPEWLGVGILVAANVAAAVFMLRRLRLRAYWLLFPPLVEGTLAGNPSVLLLACLLAGSSAIAAIAPLLKVYAVVPLVTERRWRAITIAGVLGLASLPLWTTYLSGLAERYGRLLAEADGGHSGLRTPLLLALAAVAFVALLRVDRRAAGWLAVPLLWPGAEYHWATLALPVMHPILAVGLAVATDGLEVVVIALYALWRLLEHVRAVPVVELAHGD